MGGLGYPEDDLADRELMEAGADPLARRSPWIACRFSSISARSRRVVSVAERATSLMPSRKKRRYGFHRACTS
jgi:hypothetical protein